MPALPLPCSLAAEVMDDEGYQLLFNAVAIAALAMYARMPLRLFVTFSVAAPALRPEHRATHERRATAERTFAMRV